MNLNRYQKHDLKKIHDREIAYLNLASHFLQVILYKSFFASQICKSIIQVIFGKSCYASQFLEVILKAT